ncbi:MAG: RNA pseudouridine synthase [Lentisphaeria bacterium]
MTELFLDNHLLALDCPGGLLTQPSGTTEDSLECQGKSYLKEKFQKPGAVFLEAVHRIDRPVCGVVLFARTSKALSRLNQSSRDHLITKIYHAWIEGSLPQADGRLEDWLIHDDFRARKVPAKTNGARACSLQYHTLQKKGNFTLLEVFLETGRYHQIRCQFAAIGHPIFGDQKYGSKRIYKVGCIALQHYRMIFPHPVSKKRITVTSTQEMNISI